MFIAFRLTDLALNFRLQTSPLYYILFTL